MKILKAIIRRIEYFNPFRNIDISELYVQDDANAIRQDFEAVGEDIYKCISCKYNGECRCENPIGNCLNLTDAKTKWEKLR